MGIDSYAERFIRIKAHQMVVKGVFSQSDRHDIEQELRLDLFERLPDYTPERGSLEGFVCRVVEHRISHIIARRTAGKRDPDRVEFSLDETVLESGEEETGRAAVMVDEKSPSVEQRDLALDLADALGALPPELRRLCRQLQLSTVTEIARQEGVARKTIYERIKKVRAVLHERGLDAYL